MLTLQSTGKTQREEAAGRLLNGEVITISSAPNLKSLQHNVNITDAVRKKLPRNTDRSASIQCFGDTQINNEDVRENVIVKLEICLENGDIQCCRMHYSYTYIEIVHTSPSHWSLG